jgi:DNA mismatch endonuclease (patch repair protein)
MDRLTPERRSALMSRVRGKDTAPELIVRRLLHSMGLRYRLHQRSLPGVPDIVFPSRKKVIWVHGCFWHHHDGCRLATVPKTNPKFWTEKFRKNVTRDKSNAESIAALGWKSLTVWQCELKKHETLARRLKKFVGPSPTICGEPERGDRRTKKNQL